MSSLIAKKHSFNGAGLGLRRSMLDAFYPKGKLHIPHEISFFEVAPENWMSLKGDVGGQSAQQFAEIAEQKNIVAHGLSLNLGGFAPIHAKHVKAIGKWMKRHHITLYTEHLSYTSDDGQLYDLMPIPRSASAVKAVAQRIRQVQDILGQRIGIENASTYTGTPLDELPEWDFYVEVAREADCLLHVDINNIYVNSVNFRYPPQKFLDTLSNFHTQYPDRIVYFHMAGHYQERKDFLIDTHGMPIIDPVWDLLKDAYQRFGAIPTCLERDFNFPPLAELVDEVRIIADLQKNPAPTIKSLRQKKSSLL